MIELLSVLVIATLAFLQHRADQRRLDDAFAQIAAANRIIQAQAAPTEYGWTQPPAPPADYPVPADQLWLTDASGLIAVPVEDVA